MEETRRQHTTGSGKGSTLLQEDLPPNKGVSMFVSELPKEQPLHKEWPRVYGVALHTW